VPAEDTVEDEDEVPEEDEEHDELVARLLLSGDMASSGLWRWLMKLCGWAWVELPALLWWSNPMPMGLSKRVPPLGEDAASGEKPVNALPMVPG
jgi:hypothetical protein